MLRLFFSILLLLSSLYASEDWKFETVFDGESNRATQLGKTMLYRSSDMSTHIFYGGDHLYHLEYNGTWSQETVDGANNVGAYISSSVAPNGSLHVSYLDRDNATLKYATKELNSDRWNIIQTDLNATRNTSLCTDENNIAHIFYGLHQEIHYVTSDDFTLVQNFAANSKRASVACDSSGLHVAYYVFDEELKGLWYADNHTGDFVHRRIFASDDFIDSTSIDANTLSGNKAIGIIYADTFQFFDTAIENYDQPWNESLTYDALGHGSSVVVKNSDVSASFIARGNNSSTIVKIITKHNRRVVQSDIDSNGGYYNHSSIAYMNGELKVQYSTVNSANIGWIYKDENAEYKDEHIKRLSLQSYTNMDMKIHKNRPYITFDNANNSIEYLTKNTDATWSSYPMPKSNVGGGKLSIIDNGFADTWVHYINRENGAYERRKYAHYFSNTFPIQSGWKWNDLEARDIFDNANMNTRNSVLADKHDTATFEGASHSCFIDSDGALFYTLYDNEENINDTIELDQRANRNKLSCVIDLDDTGHVHIAYTVERGFRTDLYYISNETGLWEYEELLALVEDSKKNLHIQVHNGIVHIGFFKQANPSSIEYLQSSSYSADSPRQWPSVSSEVYSSEYINNLFDMLVDANAEVHFAFTFHNAINHFIKDNDTFKREITPLRFFITGIKMDLSDGVLHLLLINRDNSDLLFATLKNKAPITPSIIMYLLH